MGLKFLQAPETGSVKNIFPLRRAEKFLNADFATCFAKQVPAKSFESCLRRKIVKPHCFRNRANYFWLRRQDSNLWPIA